MAHPQPPFAHPQRPFALPQPSQQPPFVLPNGAYIRAAIDGMAAPGHRMTQDLQAYVGFHQAAQHGDVKLCQLPFFPHATAVRCSLAGDNQG